MTVPLPVNLVNPERDCVPQTRSKVERARWIRQRPHRRIRASQRWELRDHCPARWSDSRSLGERPRQTRSLRIQSALGPGKSCARFRPVVSQVGEPARAVGSARRWSRASHQSHAVGGRIGHGLYGPALYAAQTRRDGHRLRRAWRGRCNPRAHSGAQRQERDNNNSGFRAHAHLTDDRSPLDNRQ